MSSYSILVLLPNGIIIHKIVVTFILFMDKKKKSSKICNSACYSKGIEIIIGDHCIKCINFM